MRSTEHEEAGYWDSGFACLPSFRGKMRLIDALAGVARWVGGNEREVCFWADAKFGLDLRDRIQRQMWCGCYEPHVTKALRRILRAGDTFVDAGAHIEYHSYFAAGLVGPGGRVFAFEADPGNFARLEKNLKHFPHAKAYHCAMWSHEQKLIFGRPASITESGWGALARVRRLETSEQVEIDGISLDKWSTQRGVQEIRAVKIDVEGAEVATLRGAENVLEKMRPILLLEMNGSLLKQAGTSATIAEQLLRSKGYELYWLVDGTLQSWQAVKETEFVDCVAMPKEHLGMEAPRSGLDERR